MNVEGIGRIWGIDADRLDDRKEVIFEYSKPADKFLRKHEDSIMKIYRKFRG